MFTLIMILFTAWIIIKLIGIAFDGLEVIIFGVSEFITTITGKDENRIFPWVFWIITLLAIGGFVWFFILH